MLTKEYFESAFGSTNNFYESTRPLSRRIRRYIDGCVQEEVDRQCERYADAVIDNLQFYLNKHPIVIK